MRKRETCGVCEAERFLGLNKTLLWVALQLLGEYDLKCKGLNQAGEEFTDEETRDQRLGKMAIGVGSGKLFSHGLFQDAWRSEEPVEKTKLHEMTQQRFGTLSPKDTQDHLDKTEAFL